MLKLADVEVCSKFTSLFWECRCNAVKDCRCQKTWLWEAEHVALSILDVDVVEVKASGLDVFFLTDVVFEVTGCTPIIVVVVVL